MGLLGACCKPEALERKPPASDQRPSCRRIERRQLNYEESAPDAFRPARRAACLCLEGLRDGRPV